MILQRIFEISAWLWSYLKIVFRAWYWVGKLFPWKYLFKWKPLALHFANIYSLEVSSRNQSHALGNMVKSHGFYRFLIQTNVDQFNFSFFKEYFFIQPVTSSKRWLFHQGYLMRIFLLLRYFLLLLLVVVVVPIVVVIVEMVVVALVVLVVLVGVLLVVKSWPGLVNTNWGPGLVNTI